MTGNLKFTTLGRLIWLSLFGRWMFGLLVPWFVPIISYLLIGKSYLASLTNFAFGSAWKQLDVLYQVFDHHTSSLNARAAGFLHAAERKKRDRQTLAGHLRFGVLDERVMT